MSRATDMHPQEAQKKVLIMAAGTGGHVFPALSIARFLKAEGVAVEWLGTPLGMEARIVQSEGIPMHSISIGGLRGKSLVRKLLAPVQILWAIYQSCLRIWKARPDCVLGMGGFVTGPGGIAAWLMRKPLLIHEQNAIAGFTNLMLMPFATIMMEAFPGSFVRKRMLDGSLVSRLVSRKADKVQAVGNPVREEISVIAEPEKRLQNPGLKRVLVIGGSLGAVALNRLVPEVLAMFGPDSRPEVWHQCGEKNLADAEQAYQHHGIAMDEKARLVTFIDDMAVAYNWADLVVCRAGALTISELASAGVASILVPYPYAVDDHQTENARYLVDGDAAVMIQERQLDANSLYQQFSTLLNDGDRLLSMATQARALAKSDAREIVGRLCLGVCHA